jgi:L-amino acid N-acyltransferase YncA
MEHDKRAFFEVDQMTRQDWAKVRGIHAEGLATGLAAFRTHPPIWKDWDASHLPFGRLVARRDRAILGWAALAPVADT